MAMFNGDRVPRKIIPKDNGSGEANSFFNQWIRSGIRLGVGVKLNRSQRFLCKNKDFFVKYRLTILK
jgi:hypothetical protein